MFFYVFRFYVEKKNFAPGNGGGRHMILFDLLQVFDMKNLEGSWNPSWSKLVKMKCIDVSETVIEWFKTYLTYFTCFIWQGFVWCNYHRMWRSSRVSLRILALLVIYKRYSSGFNKKQRIFICCNIIVFLLRKTSKWYWKCAKQRIYNYLRVF